MNLANGALRSITKSVVDGSRVTVATFPASAIATPLPVDYDVANLDQNPAKENAKEASMPLVGEGVDCMEQGSDTTGDSAVENPATGDPRLDEGRRKSAKCWF